MNNICETEKKDIGKNYCYASLEKPNCPIEYDIWIDTSSSDMKPYRFIKGDWEEIPTYHL